MTLRRWLAASLLLTAACSGDSTAPSPASVVVAPSTRTLDVIGATTPFTAQVLDGDGNPLTGETVTWSSGTPSVASVDPSTGVATALSEGSSQISATVDGVSGSGTLVVDPAPAELTKVSGDAQTGTVGEVLGAPVVVEVRDGGGTPLEGIEVDFSVAAGDGSVSPTVVTTDAQGRASASWTLGTLSSEAHTLRAEAGTVSATFEATAEPAAAEAVAIAGGDGQAAPPGAPLTDSLEVRVQDGFGNPVPGVEVEWSTADGGTLDPAASTSGTDGVARSRWTLGGDEGVQTATATLEGGASVDFSATAGTTTGGPSISSISPDTLVEGEAATITGENFAASAADNAVLIGGVAATVTAASPTSLDVTVPTFDCRPARRAVVSVTAAGAGSTPVEHPVRPAEFLDLDVGEQLVLRSPSDACLQFDGDDGESEFLFGVQSLAVSTTDLTPVQVTGERDPGSAAVAALAPRRAPAAAGPSGVDPVASGAMSLLRAHRQAESELRIQEARMFEADRPAPAVGAAAGPPAAVPASVEVGDTVEVRMRDRTATTCGPFVTVEAVVRAKGTRGIWLEDVDNPAGGFSEAQYQELADQFDSDIMSTIEATFGDPTDLDSNDRVVILVTREINIENGTTGGLLGFVTNCDFLNQSANGASNEGEFFYLVAPDPNSVHGQEVPADGLFALAPLILAHELTHVVQFGQRITAGRPLMASFVAEGQATLSEEVVGHEVEGNAPGMNYGIAVAFNADADQQNAWYLNAFADLVFFFGGVPGDQDQSEQQPGAPEQCSWLANITDPCVSRASWYGVTWSFLRWASDNLVSDTPAFQRSLIDSDLTGFPNLEAALGASIEDLLPRWAAMLYLDDRISGLPDDLTLPSWNLFHIFESGEAVNPDGDVLIQTGRLIPRDRAFEDFQDDLSVRTASTGYFRVSGEERPATAIRVRGAGGGALPAHMQVFVVRMR